MNTDELASALMRAEIRVLEIQTKLHRWATNDPHKKFDDLFNLVTDPAFLLVAWDRVRGNKGAKTAGVDGRTAASIQVTVGVQEFLNGLRSSLKDRTFCPLPVRERMIPKAGGKLRRLGIPTIADRVVQASLKLVLEPIFEADFLPCSYGFRPKRRARDAVAEVTFLTSGNSRYDWIVEGDIKACFDEISHPALMHRVRMRISDKRVLDLVKAFLKAGILSEERMLRKTDAGAPQGAILSPLLSNVALAVLDEHIAQAPGGPSSAAHVRLRRRAKGLPNVRLVRYADDWCLMVAGTREDADALREEIAGVLATMGLRLSEDKTLITHIEEGLDFLGWRIQRHVKKGTADQRHVYTYPSKKALANITGKIKTLCRQTTNQTLADLLLGLNQAVAGWCQYFRPGVSFQTFQYLRAFLWKHVWSWIRRKHPKTTWKDLRRRYSGGRWWPSDDGITLFDPGKVRTIVYRYRGAKIPTPWSEPI
ncbi:group II intron reverse transcriptase/maturase [Catellatospora bangladeshensis]|uniref:Group II intron reverse transcriptase/maturase n=1 Tax=Catellatospora bangladeshensis TaxID=310355 RepID=A0A8J3NID4_9ACTN|nr:group II intron reverse transcriptase/maturase [Catellatospora bangladeshensis]GIF82047.1 group II intron reverse transcriptase/maturase [Catellatospora bangladeshensis]